MAGLLLTLVALAAPVVEGRVAEPGGAAVQGAQVTLVQGARTQVRLTGADGGFRFRAFEGPGTVSVRLPQGWMAAGPSAAAVEARAGRVVEAGFAARAHRVLRGRLLLAGAPVPDVDVIAGGVQAHTDAHGFFSADGVPAGRVEVRLELLSGVVEVPPAPGEVPRDILLAVPALRDLRLRRVPQPAADRPVQSWIAGKPLTGAEVAGIERLCAVANLDPAFRLVLLASPEPRPDGLVRAAAAARLLARYLIGPGLLARERVAFAIDREVAPAGHLALVLMRPEGE